MKIFFRYLFARLFVPFAICLGACTLIWIMVNLYGNIDDFLGHKVGIMKILYFYSLQIPSMLVQVLPAALLFSTLWTLISLNRRCELVAFQSGGMAPIWLFSPFFAFALIWTVVLAFDLNWPAAKAEVTRERVLEQVKGGYAKNNVLTNLPYIDTVNRRIWFFQKLDANQNTADGIEILQRDDDGNDRTKYFAQRGKWNGEFWQLTGVLKINYGASGLAQDQRTYEILDLPDITTPPKQLSLIVSQPEQLSVSELSQYIATGTGTLDNMAKYRTEWWYRVLYPLTLIVLMLFGLLQGARADRRNAMAGVFGAIVVLLAYILVSSVFMAAGKYNRMSPFLSVAAAEIIFGGIAVYLLAVNNGWWAQLVEAVKRWQGQAGAEDSTGPQNPS